MYYKVEDDNLIFKSNHTSPNLQVPISNFIEITSIMYHQKVNSIFLTAKKFSGLKPGLHRWSIDQARWTEIYNKECYNPVPMPNSTDLALDVGNGVAVLDHTGQLKASCRVTGTRLFRRQLTPSPDGSRIMFCRYRQTHWRFVLFDIGGNSTAEYKPSWYSYSWFDNQTIIYEHLGHLRLLALDSGKSSVFIADLFKTPANREAISNTEIKNLFLPGGELDTSDFNYRDIQTHGNRIYFKMTVKGKTPKDQGQTRDSVFDFSVINSVSGKITPKIEILTIDATTQFNGLFSINKDKTGFKVEYLCPPEHFIDKFEVDNDGTLVFALRQLHHREIVSINKVIVGNPNSLLYDGWMIMPEGNNPERSPSQYKDLLKFNQLPLKLS